MQKTIAVVYVEHLSTRPFDEVVELFEDSTGQVEGGSGYTQAVKSADDRTSFETLIHTFESTSGFMRFLALDHGAWMQKFEGGTQRGKVYTLGNPLIARTMLSSEIAAGLNVPVRVYIYEGTDGTTHFAYHLPSSLMLAYDNASVMEACDVLDVKLAHLAELVTGASA